MAAIFPLPESSPGRRSLVVIDGGRASRVDPVADRRHRAIALVVGAVALVLVVLGVAVAFSFLDQMSQPPVAQSVADVGDGAATGSVVVVQAGDTLTSIARDLQPDGDIGPLVERLAAIHGPGPLLAGDRLDVPMSVTGTG